METAQQIAVEYRVKRSRKSTVLNKPYRESRLPRLFNCGCVAEDNSGVVRIHTSLFCARHIGKGSCTDRERSKLIGLVLTCEDCGKVVVIDKTASRRKYCDDCYLKRFRPALANGRKVEKWCPSEYDIEYAQSHPWLYVKELADDLGIAWWQANKLRDMAGVCSKRYDEAKEWALERWFAENVPRVVYGEKFDI